MKLQYKDLVSSQEDKICALLECDKDELLDLYKNTNSIFNNRDSFYNNLLKILQQGYNVREATFSGILVGYLLGYRNYKYLPSYCAYFDVAWLPLIHNNYTKSMFPMKFFEYLAAGLPVVSTNH